MVFRLLLIVLLHSALFAETGEDTKSTTKEVTQEAFSNIETERKKLAENYNKYFKELKLANVRQSQLIQLKSQLLMVTREIKLIKKQIQNIRVEHDEPLPNN